MNEQYSPRAPAGHPRRWLILAVILVAEVMDMMDGTVTIIATPAIHDDLHAGPSSIQWITGGYALALAVGLITGGRLGDRYGRRRLFEIGTAGFTLASLACAVAPSTGVLVAARLVQGAFAALMIPQGFGLIRAVFPPAELPKAFAMFGPVIGLSAVFAPALGGFLVGLGSWRWVFLVNLPLGLVALAASMRTFPEDRAARPPRIDPAGAALLTVAATALILPLIQGRELGWPAWTFASMAASVLLFAAFGAHVVRRDRAGADPLVTPRLFRRRAYTGGLAVMIVFFGGMTGLLLAVTLHLQLAMGFTATHAGLALIPFSLAMAAGATLGGGVLAPRFGRRVLHAGLALFAAGTLVVAGEVNGATALSTWDLVPGFLLSGLGIGLVVAPLFSVILAGVADDEVGSASGTLNAVQQLGGAIGVAVLGTVFFGATEALGSDGALERVLWIVAGAQAVAFALAFLLPMHPREEEHGDAVELVSTAA
jgi:EmrB/QacA subfamily drug resistance transporter